MIIYKYSIGDIMNLTQLMEDRIKSKYSNQIVGVYSDGSERTSVALFSNEVINQKDIDMVEDLVDEYCEIAEIKLDAIKTSIGERVFDCNATHWDELESDDNPDGIALTVSVNFDMAPESSAKEVAKYFEKLVDNCLTDVGKNANITKLSDIKESTIINEGTFSEIDNAIQEYIMHVKKFDASVSVDDCIDFCADVLDMDVNALWELENSNGTISDGLSEYFNEGFRQTHRHLIKEAKKVLEKNGYIVK